MQNQPFFERVGAHFRVNRVGAGPWDPNSVHGRIVIGLLAHEIEIRHGSEDFVPARLTVDMYRLPGFDDVTVETRAIRDGKRIKVVDAEYFSGGTSMARATCQLLRRTASPEGTVWSPPNWDVPKPEAIEPPADQRAALAGMWEIRQITGWMGTRGPRRVWMREVRELVGGLPLSPFVRAALASDFASPFANAGDKGLGYINSDVTLYLHRPMKAEWTGLEVSNHQATAGVAIGECFLYDTEGPIGTASVAALAQRRNMG
jgi:acyl-CoA thioesterase